MVDASKVKLLVLCSASHITKYDNPIAMTFNIFE